MTQPKETEPACESCGVPWTDHLGIVFTCRELTETVKAIARSPFEMGPCQICGKKTIYLADGMAPLCEPCAEEMRTEQ